MNKITDYKPPFTYDPEGQFITDYNGHIVLDIRGWSLFGSVEKQDAFGTWVALALTEQAERSGDGFAQDITDHDLRLMAQKWVEDSTYHDANATSFAAGYRIAERKHLKTQPLSRNERSGETLPDGWISVEDRPLFINTPHGWKCTEDGEREFIAALPYSDSKRPNEELWWIRHCVVVDSTGLCVVTDDDTEPAGWNLEDVTHWMPLPAPPSLSGNKKPESPSEDRKPERESRSDILATMYGELMYMRDNQPDHYAKGKYIKKMEAISILQEPMPFGLSDCLQPVALPERTTGKEERLFQFPVHPLTCCGPADIAECQRVQGLNEGELVETTDGYVCPCGKYTQKKSGISASVEKKNENTNSVRCQKEQEGSEKCKTVCYKCLTTKVY
jgi:hypothetical protein